MDTVQEASPELSGNAALEIRAEYIVVLCRYDAPTKAYYAYSLEDALKLRDDLEESEGGTWRVCIALR